MSGFNNLDHGDVENQTLDRWYLAYTKPRQEAVAHVNLEQQGFEAYLPLFKKFKTYAPPGAYHRGHGNR